MWTADEQHFFIRWTLVTGLAWGVALLLGGVMLFVGVVLSAIVPRLLLWLLWPLMGLAIGGTVGKVQQIGLDELHPYEHWTPASAYGGALGGLGAGVLAVILPFEWLLAQVLVGAGLAAGVGFGQVFWGGVVDDAPMRAAYRWAMVNGVAGAACAWITPVGQNVWLLVSWLFGVAIFGAITGGVILRVRRN